MDGEDDDFCSWCGILELLLQPGANVDDPAVQKARRLCSYSTALSIVTVKIAQLSRNSRWVVAQRVENLRSQLLVRGAKDKSWTEVAKDSRPGRESTPAPWRRDNSNPIENLFKQVDIGPRPRMPITLDEARECGPSENESRPNTSREKNQQVGNEARSSGHATRSERDRKYLPLSLNWYNVPASSNSSEPLWKRVPWKPIRTQVRSRSNSAALNDPQHSSIPEKVVPARRSTPESSGSDSELRRGRRRVRTDIDSVHNSSDSEASDASSIQINGMAEYADKIGNQEGGIYEHIREPFAGIPNRWEMDPVKSLSGKKRPGKWKLGIQISAMFKR